MQVLHLDGLINLSDEELVLKCGAGEDSAFGILVSRYMPLVKNRASRFYQSSIDIDDMIQEGLLGLLKAVQTYDVNRGASFAYYSDICISARLLTAVKSMKTDSRKSMLDYLSIEDYEVINDYMLDTVHAEQDPFNIFIRKEELAHMENQAKILLTRFENTALRLYLSGHSYCEMAQKMKTSPKSVDNALQRIRRKLRT